MIRDEEARPVRCESKAAARRRVAEIELGIQAQAVGVSGAPVAGERRDGLAPTKITAKSEVEAVERLSRG